MPPAGPPPGGAPSMPAPAAAPPPVPPGPTAPATQPPVNEGLIMQGKVKASIGMKALTMALAALGAESPEGQVVAKALADLGKAFGQVEEGLEKAELKQLAQTAPAVSSPGPGQQAAFGDMAKAQLGRLGMAPGGAGPA